MTRRHTTTSLLWRLVHLIFLTRAISRGPTYLAGYEIRRQSRRAAWRATRRMR